MAETALYEPVKRLLTDLGYEVKAEVGDCDVFAVSHQGKTLAVELKLRLNLDVIVQAALRQKLADEVYIAVPSPRRADLKRRQNVSYVLRRLSIGLITVRPDGAKVTFPAKALDVRAALKRAEGKREALLREFSLRHGDENVGGTNGKIMTVYREQALLLAALCEQYGAIAKADAAALSGVSKARSIVEKNYYGWFREKDGSFTVTEAALTALSDYRALADRLLYEAEGTVCEKR